MLATDGAKVPTMSSERSGVLPWLKMITALAPAACALSAFSANVHVPRWISAMLRAGKPAKSAASHPLVEARGWHQIDVHWGHRGGEVPGSRCP